MKKKLGIHSIIGWFVFAASFTVYFHTLESVASLWDSGEFIAASYLLQIPHPPGAPVYLLLGRLLSFLAGSNHEQIAFFINMFSAFASAFTIMFLYWTIVLIGKKIRFVKVKKQPDLQIILVLSAITGALSFAFTDSFWFSAVETEVYAFSSLLTAIVFWSILKWEQQAEKPDSDKWLILIFFMIGVSIGVHLLNLLTIPAVVLVFYFKNFTSRPKGIVIALLIGFALLWLVMDGIIIGFPMIAVKLEMLLINGFNLPFGTGILVFMIALVSLLIYGIRYSIKKRQRILNTSLLCLAFLMIGYASYGLIVIRSNKNPLMDQNNPENIISFIRYLKRDQYYKPPLIYGPNFNAELIDQIQGDPIYRKGEKSYEISSHSLENIYNPESMTVLPRMWSKEYSEKYREITDLKPQESPRFEDNLYFLFVHQIGHMYVRYFMWNFAGRESDEMGAGWLSPLDKFTTIPGFIRSNRAHNNYLMVPLILGLIGFFFTYSRSKNQWMVILTLFLMTGIAIVFYLNSGPIEPRERDYVYIGSFYAFSIWIGLGIMGLSQKILQWVPITKMTWYISGVIGMTSIGLLVSEGWNDHDRTGRYYSVDMAKNLLASCPENAILFTGGDNDTFPLWYVQMVEGYRSDVRVIVTSYFNSDWYAEQMTRQALDSDPLPIQIPMKYLRDGGKNDYLPYQKNNHINSPVNLTSYLDLVRKDHPVIQIKGNWGTMNTLPFRQFYLDVQREKIFGTDIVPEKFEAQIKNRLLFSLRADYILKSDLLILDLIDSIQWERPICFSYTALKTSHIDFDPMVIKRGLIYQLVPLDFNQESTTVNMDTVFSYDLIMNRYAYRGLNDRDVYYNENYRQYLMNFRSHYNELAFALIQEREYLSAEKVLDKSLEMIPDCAIPYDYTSLDTVRIYLTLNNDDQKALEIADVMSKRLDQQLTYLLEDERRKNKEKIFMDLSYMQSMAIILKQRGHEDLAGRYEAYFKKHYLKYAEI